MTRPKVPPDQRQRTAQACESCKRRKQKCNGLQPCNTCKKRNFQCVYVDRDVASSPQERPPKRRAVDVHPSGSPSQYGSGPNGSFSSPYGRGMDENMHRAARSLQQFALPRAGPDDRTKSFLSIVTGLSGHEGEAVVYGQARMLHDSTGRVLYVGDSATLSFLQVIRTLLEPLCGRCAFIDDPRRHRITEPQFTLSASTRLNQLLPDQRTAFILAESFFTNTHGLVNIFEKDLFMTALHASYDDPLNVDPAWLCQINLVFAIGLMLATPKLGTEEEEVISRLREQHADRAEVFYMIAKAQHDPLTGFEDADFWSIQALLLMAVFMLTKSKRNTAYALIGMAVRSAYALGLHSEATLVAFNSIEQTARKNLWKSLFVMERFVALSLGRPSAIFSDELYPDSPKQQQLSDPDLETLGDNLSFEESGSAAMDASVKTCSIIGKILKDVYQGRKIGTRLAQEIAQVLKDWPQGVQPCYRLLQAPNVNPSSAAHGIAMLHVKLLYIHSVILLTRPFLLYVLNFEVQRRVSPQAISPIRKGFRRIEKFSEACVSAATHSVAIANSAYKAGYLPQRNPWVVYFLSAAGLVLLANAFIPLHKHPLADQCIQDCLNLLNYSAETDPQAERLVYILGTFKDAVDIERMKRERPSQDTQPIQSQPPPHHQMDHPSPMPPHNTVVPSNNPNIPMPEPTPSQQPGHSNPNFTPYTNSPFATPNVLAPPPNFTGNSPSVQSSSFLALNSQGSNTQGVGPNSKSSTPAPLEPSLPPPTVPPNPLSPASAARSAAAGGMGTNLANVTGSGPPVAGVPFDPTLPFTSILEFAAYGGPGGPDGSNMFATEDGTNTGAGAGGGTADEHIEFDWFWTGGTVNGNNGGGMGMMGVGGGPVGGGGQGGQGGGQGHGGVGPQVHQGVGVAGVGGQGGGMHVGVGESVREGMLPLYGVLE